METKYRKEYIEERYRLAYLDYQTARTENEQFAARKEMARLERFAAEDYGYDYADELHAKFIQ
jgi:hypothetical protein